MAQHSWKKIFIKTLFLREIFTYRWKITQNESRCLLRNLKLFSNFQMLFWNYISKRAKKKHGVSLFSFNKSKHSQEYLKKKTSRTFTRITHKQSKLSLSFAETELTLKMIKLEPRWFWNLNRTEGRFWYVRWPRNAIAFKKII